MEIKSITMVLEFMDHLELGLISPSPKRGGSFLSRKSYVGIVISIMWITIFDGKASLVTVFRTLLLTHLGMERSLLPLRMHKYPN